MRLWTVHPKHLDTKGLVALWREGLLAKAVLEGKTRGYRDHPQLVRFRGHPRPVEFLVEYLRRVLEESQSRGYRFEATKIPAGALGVEPLEVTEGQLAYEWQHLLGKLRKRDGERYESLSRFRHPEAHPLFLVKPGPVAAWERTFSGGTPQ